MKRLIGRKGNSGSDAPATTSTTTSSASAPTGISLSRRSTRVDTQEDKHAAALQALQNAHAPSDPEDFVQAALIPIFSYNPKNDPLSFEDVEKHHVPKYFSPDYRHQTNCWEADLQGAFGPGTTGCSG
jgi:hypothetical protein